MPRRPRVIIPGVPHHITQRGNNRQQVFYCDHDRRLYLDLLTRHAPQYGTRILSYCLMTNHVHVAAVPQRDHSLARTFGRAHAEYAAALNHAERRSGHLWQNRFFSCPLDAAHQESAMRYVELNPVRAGLIAVPWAWPWSSARAHCSEGASGVLLDCCSVSPLFATPRKPASSTNWVIRGTRSEAASPDASTNTNRDAKAAPGMRHLPLRRRADNA